MSDPSARHRISVLHVAPSIAKSYGGPSYSLWGYVRASLAMGARVTVLSPEAAFGDETKAPDGAELRTFPSQGRDAFIRSPALWRHLGDEGRHHDVVHVHGLLNPVSSLASRISLKRDWPLVIRPFGTLSRYTFEHRRRTLKWMYYRALESANLRRASALHFTTTAELANAAWLGLPPEGRGHVVPPPWIAPAHTSTRAASASPTVLFVGRLNKVKAIETLLEAWPMVLTHVPDARLVITGDGEPAYVATLRQLVDRLGMRGSVHFTGFADGVEKQRLLDQATVFALPSYHENFGIAVLEALANGLPVVISPDVQLANFVTEHQLGRVTTRDPLALGLTLADTLRDEGLRAHCHTRGPLAVDEHFSTASVGARLSTMYETARQLGNG
jgi:glycosyltransferase involved in cell wall biosynthesis